MEIILKQDIIDAFQSNKRKRSNLLFTYYKDTLFFKGLSAEFIALKMSQDLGIKITPSIIYKINHRIIKKTDQRPSNVLRNHQEKYQNENKSRFEPEQHSENGRFKNADEYPQKDPFNGAFNDL